MKIAVPFEDGQVFQHFGRSAQFKFYEAENGQLLRTEVIPTNGQGHGALAGFLVQHGRYEWPSRQASGRQKAGKEHPGGCTKQAVKETFS